MEETKTYNWNEWLDGKTRSFAPGVDFHSSPEEFVRLARREAKQRAKAVRHDIDPENQVYLQAVSAARVKLQGSTKVYVVASDGFPDGGGPTLNIYHAVDLNDLAEQVLGPSLPNPEPWEYWIQENGEEGSPMYVVKELLINGTLGPDLLNPKEE